MSGPGALCYCMVQKAYTSHTNWTLAATVPRVSGSCDRPLNDQEELFAAESERFVNEP